MVVWWGVVNTPMHTQGQPTILPKEVTSPPISHRSPMHTQGQHTIHPRGGCINTHPPTHPPHPTPPQWWGVANTCCTPRGDPPSLQRRLHPTPLPTPFELLNLPAFEWVRCGVGGWWARGWLMGGWWVLGGWVWGGWVGGWVVGGWLMGVGWAGCGMRVVGEWVDVLIPNSFPLWVVALWWVGGGLEVGGWVGGWWVVGGW